MAADVSDGVRALIKSGLVDRNRIIAEGVGFGAYLAMCGALEEPDLYRCAILYGGTFDWESQFRKKDSPTRSQDQWIERRLHELSLTPPSPFRRADRLKRPIFFTRNVHIRDVTYDSQISEFHRRMKSRVPCEYFGDMNLMTPNEAYKDTAERLDKILSFLSVHAGLDRIEKVR
jgi:pimeloyl-ACP methyl ester carboxylesterase